MQFLTLLVALFAGSMTGYSLLTGQYFGRMWRVHHRSESEIFYWLSILMGTFVTVLSAQDFFLNPPW